MKYLFKSRLLAKYGVLWMLALGSLSAITSLAQTNSELRETCKLIYDFAEAIMARRQKNEALPAVLGLADKAGGYKELIEALTIDAYNIPLEVTEPEKQEAIRSFANNSYLACVQ